MTLVQSIFSRVMPRHVVDRMEAESRAWKAKCPCGCNLSFWERGGVRFGASGKPQQLLKCPECQQWTMHTVTREGLSDEF
ncbi:MAG: hypothetical protein JSR82_18675 [Verrucomicrobia bacterium]|nr:hypothetical protein [Verrucomicrobiota bacterium]